MKKQILAFAAGVSLFLTGTAFAQQDMDDVTIEAEQITDTLYVLFGRGGNIGVSAGPDGVFLIDDQFAPLTDRILDAISGITDQPVKFVLNTHYHGDHTGGNENMGKAGAVILAHDNVRMRLMSEEAIALIQSLEDPQPANLPVITFDSGLSLHLNADYISVRHVPHAHTDGDSLIFFNLANVVHMGDTYFHNRFPYIDVNAGGHIDGVIEAANLVIENTDDETVIIPGHGPLSNRTELETYRDTLQTIRDRIAALMAQGLSEDEIVEANPASDWEGDYNWNFINAERFVRSVVQSLLTER